MENKEKPIVLLPGDKRVLDGYTPVIYAGTAIALAVFAFALVTSLVLILSWRPLPGLPLPESNGAPFFHVLQYFNHWVLGWFWKLDSYRSYGGWMNHLIEINQIHLVAFRHFTATVAGGFASYAAFKYSWKSVDNQRQIRGKKLLRGREATDDLKAKWDAQNAATVSAKFPKGRRALILATDKGFQPNKKETFDKKAKVIRMPDDQRRTHFLFLGGSRRGKGVTLKQFVMQIYYRILNGSWDKLMIIDTPKGEYGSLFKQKYTVQLAPDEKHQMEYWVAKDLEYTSDIKAFWAGRIPTNEKESYWSDSPRFIGTAIMVFLNSQCGHDWNMAHFAYWKDKSQKELIELSRNYYQDALKTFESPENTYNTHTSSLSVNTADMIELAKIWNGFQYKHEIHQMTVALLKKKFWSTWFVNTAYPLTKIVTKDEEDVEVEIPENRFTHFLITGLLGHMNSKGNWTWKELKDVLSQPIKKQINFAKKYIDKSDHIYFSETLFPINPKYRNFLMLSQPVEPNLKVHAHHIIPIITKAEIWDKFEGMEKFSLKDWILDENPKKKILLIKPSGRFKDQTVGLIRGMLFFMAGLINDKYFPEDKTEECPHIRRFHIVCDEFQALGNLKEFLGPGMEMFASKGVTIYLACQDLSQLKELYGENMLAFLQSNTGNVQIMGVNVGSSAEMISNQLGKKTILKRHESTTYQDNGKSTSVNYQEHEGVVMDPDEINKLGTKIEPKRKYVRYLYIPGNMDNAYILEAEIASYPVLYKPEKPDWMTGGGRQEPLFFTEKEILELITKPKPVKEAIETLSHAPGGTMAPPSPITYSGRPDDDTSFDLDDEIDDEPEPNYDAQFLQEATARVEQQEVFYLKQEEEPLEGSIAVDFAIESMLDSPILHALKSGAEVKDKSSSTRTTDKKAWVASMLKKKHNDYNTVDRETQR